MLNSLDLEGRPQDTRVVVAMSGGVDSSVTAALLKAEGYDVVGVTLQLYDHGAATHRKGACCAGQDIHDARSVADRIGIPHYVLDYESRFKEAVIDRFAESYVAGETPVPCVDCNMAIKFKDLLGTARELGAKVLATGHYVASRALPGGGRALYRAKEEERDQSYFLFGTTHAQLDLLRFPLGDLSKAQTRELARRFGLAVADKHDSQDICFVPTGRYTDVIERLKPGAAAAGDIVDLDGKVLGRHDGIIHFTIGQRRGLKIAAPRRSTWWRSMPPTQRVVVGPREALTMRRIALRDVNWIGEGALDRVLDAGRIEVFVKVRSTRPPRAAFLSATAGGYRDRTGRRRGRRVARPGLRVLRRRAGPGPRARRRLHPRRGGDGEGGVISRGRWGRRSTATRSRRRTIAGRRSTTWCSARCSSGPHGRDRGGRGACRSGGGRILEVGVGTGISLLSYGRSNRLVGIDISAGMLRRAHDRVVEHGLTNVEALAVMDAKHLAVPDASFDVVVAQYVITAVPDPEATLDEFVRVLKPGGEIILVNHLGAESGFRRAFEQGFSPMARRLGWSPEFPWERLTRLGRARRRAADRAPADAAARAFLADPLRQALTRH